MYRSKLKNSFVLSFILLILILVQSIFSLLFPEIYRDNRWIVIALKGSDLTTLAIVIPSLIISLFYSRRGNLRAQIIWLGTVYFIFYSSMFYVFGTVYNKFFLIYILIFNVSALTLIKGLFNLDYKLIGESIKVTADLKKISWFIFLYITILLIMWLSQYIVFVLTDTIPPIYLENGNFAHLIATLNLTLIVVSGLIGAYYLLIKHPFGFVFTIMFFAQSIYLFILLVFAAIYHTLAGIPGSWDLIPLWAIIIINMIFFLVVLLKNINQKELS